MKKFFSTLFWLIFFAVGGYFIYQFYVRIKAIFNISKTLPQYLKNVIGEKPELDIDYKLVKVILDLKFAKETIEKNEDIANTVREYINDFYPMFKPDMIEINVLEKEEPIETFSKEEDLEKDVNINEPETAEEGIQEAEEE